MLGPEARWGAASTWRALGSSATRCSRGAPPSARDRHRDRARRTQTAQARHRNGARAPTGPQVGPQGPLRTRTAFPSFFFPSSFSRPFLGTLFCPTLFVLILCPFLFLFLFLPLFLLSFRSLFFPFFLVVRRGSGGGRARRRTSLCLRVVGEAVA